MTDETPSTEEEALLDRSSFGTDAARSLRARTTPDQVDEALRRARALRPPPASEPPQEESPQLVELHRALAELLAARGNWRAAYRHLHAALDLVDRAGTPEDTGSPAAVVDLADVDPLTGAYTRRSLDKQLDDALTEPRTALAVAMVDLDWFSQVNNTFGHLLGDRVLAKVATLLLRETFCARYGGEEFVLLFPGRTAEEAGALTEKLRVEVERFRWNDLAPGLRVTMSAGVTDASHASTADQALRRADGLLYTAKQHGRNVVAYHNGSQVVLASRGEPRATTATTTALRANRFEPGMAGAGSPRYLEGEPDPDALFGAEEQAVPPVIGE
ncbi:GGDEF domain-containing protein [Amycolatopsis sp. YIM 10]|uniref:GGDEF domain-containing protein n=1 Tax=Amycolatopsis sp. YIM 10 TaxID=2653857 RepID=UPI0012A94CE4|nr:GGDEF domain-containing protein [Amycolatopsis sp. YIM 10]QFU91825.1 Response regulator PleD [Amycolatopsis sp. YIM 10]